MKAKILRLIRERKGCITLQELCRECNASKETVIHIIKQLQMDGYDIVWEMGKGYQLLSYPETLSAQELMSRINTEWAGKYIYYREETESTNEDAKYLAEEAAKHGSLVVASCQKGGKGRRGRNWNSPKGTSISMSLLLRPEFLADKASMLTLVMALSVAETLNQLLNQDVKIKWPNDVLLNKKKVCGILTELITHEDGTYSVIIGVGINVNQKEFPEEIAETATSILMELGDRYSRSDIILGVMEYFEYYYGLFADSEDLSSIVELYDGYLVNKDNQVRVLDPKGEFEGVATGINDQGELIVKKADGTISAVYAGEVSVRGIYGYV